jgi:hypothetical protein
MASLQSGTNQEGMSPQEVRERINALVRPLDNAGCLSWFVKFVLLIAFLVTLTQAYGLFTGSSWFLSMFYALLICTPPLVLLWWLAGRYLYRNHLERTLQRFDAWFPPGGSKRRLAVSDLMGRPDASNDITGTGRLIAALRDRGDPLVFGPLEPPEKTLADAMEAAGMERQEQHPQTPVPPAVLPEAPPVGRPVAIDTRGRTPRPEGGDSGQGPDWFSQLSDNRPLPLELDPPPADEEKRK